jgi:hypothetical protein
MNVSKLSHNMPSDMLRKPLLIPITCITWTQIVYRRRSRYGGPFGFEILEAGIPITCITWTEIVYRRRSRYRDLLDLRSLKLE